MNNFLLIKSMAVAQLTNSTLELIIWSSETRAPNNPQRTF